MMARNGYGLLEAWFMEVTKDEARGEILRHHPDGLLYFTAPCGTLCFMDAFEAFLDDVGDRMFYSGEEVLSWLGY